jgi:hypothetical protein
VAVATAKYITQNRQCKKKFSGVKLKALNRPSMASICFKKTVHVKILAVISFKVALVFGDGGG